MLTGDQLQAANAALRVELQAAREQLSKLKAAGGGGGTSGGSDGPTNPTGAAAASERAAEHAEELDALREQCETLEQQLEASQAGQAKAWALTAQFLSKRLQAAANDCPGREPDMSAAAAEAFAAVLSDVGGMALQAWAAEEAPEAEAPAP